MQRIVSKYVKLINPATLLIWGSSSILSTIRSITPYCKIYIIDYDPSVHTASKKLFEDDVYMHFILVQCPLNRMDSIIWDKYATPYTSLTFDIIIVNGVVRQKCLKQAGYYLSRDGVVIMPHCYSKETRAALMAYEILEITSGTACLKTPEGIWNHYQ